MSQIVVENLRKDILSRKLLENISFSISDGEKIALVAQNGKGKSTILKILAGLIDYDDGKITIQNNLNVGYLPQEPIFSLEKTIEEELFNNDSKILAAVKEYNEALNDTKNEKRLIEATKAMNDLNAWSYESKLKEILEKLKITNVREKIGNLSGGQRKRLALVKILLDDHDLLLLDEPTNHLDIEMIEWLGDYLKQSKISILLVTHDRYFLDKVCNRILEIDRGEIHKHNGNYLDYLDAREKRHIDQNLQIDKKKSYLKKELAVISKAPRGRLSKPGRRIRDYEIESTNIGSKNVTEKVKLESVTERLGTKILEFYNVNKRFGDKVILNQFSYKFKRNEKIGIVGDNGTGKTTFLNIILDKEPIDSGKIIKGETLKFGYYSQHQENLNENHKVIESVKEIATEIRLTDKFISAEKMLERFLFKGSAQQDYISTLSGGEKKRLSLLRVLMSNPNFLILDEPTNDFDLLTLEILEEFLLNFTGCLIIVSHDRYFMDNIVDHLLVFEGNGVIQDFPGNYSSYRESLIDTISTNQESTESEQQKDNNSSKEANILYREISKLESKIANLEKKLYDLGSDFEEIAKVSEKINSLKSELEEKTEKWLLIS